VDLNQTNIAFYDLYVCVCVCMYVCRGHRALELAQVAFYDLYVYMYVCMRRASCTWTRPTWLSMICMCVYIYVYVYACVCTHACCAASIRNASYTWSPGQLGILMIYVCACARVDACMHVFVYVCAASIRRP
jgi:hypothetical protein